MAIKDQMNISNLLQQQAIDTLMKQQGQGGLLGQPQSRLQAGLLGAAQGLAPYMGYSTTPTTFGQAAVAGLTGAAGGIQQQQQQQLQDALTQLQLASELKPKDNQYQSAFFKEIADIDLAVSRGELTPDKASQLKEEKYKTFTGQEYAPSGIEKKTKYVSALLGRPEEEVVQQFIDSPEKILRETKIKLLTSPGYANRLIDDEGIDKILEEIKKDFEINTPIPEVEVPTDIKADTGMSIISDQYKAYESVDELINATMETNPSSTRDQVIELLKNNNIIK